MARSRSNRKATGSSRQFNSAGVRFPLARWSFLILLAGLVLGALYWVSLRRPASGIIVSLSENGESTLEQIRQSQSLSELQIVAAEVFSRLNQRTPQDQLVLVRILDATAVRRMELAPDDAQRSAGLRDHLVATQTLAMNSPADHPDHSHFRQALLELGQEHRDHPDSAVAIEALVCLALNAKLSAERAQPDQVREARELILEIADRYPAEPKVIRAVETILDGYSRSTRAQAHLPELIAAITQGFAGSENSNLSRWARQVAEKQRLVELGVLDALQAASRGDASKLDLLNTAARTLLENGPSEFAIGRAIELAQFLECADRPDWSREILTTAIAAIPRGDRLPEFDTWQQQAQTGLQRLDLKGQPLRLEFLAVDGRRLSAAELSQSICLFHFVGTQPDFAAIKALVRSLERFQPQGVVFVLIVQGSAADQLMAHFAPGDPFCYLVSEPEKEGALTSAGKITYYPSTLVLNRGVVAKTGIPSKDLPLFLESIVFQPGK